MDREAIERGRLMLDTTPTIASKLDMLRDIRARIAESRERTPDADVNVFMLEDLLERLDLRIRELERRIFEAAGLPSGEREGR